MYLERDNRTPPRLPVRERALGRIPEIARELASLRQISLTPEFLEGLGENQRANLSDQLLQMRHLLERLSSELEKSKISQ